MDKLLGRYKKTFVAFEDQDGDLDKITEIHWFSLIRDPEGYYLLHTMEGTNEYRYENIYKFIPKSVKQISPEEIEIETSTVEMNRFFNGITLDMVFEGKTIHLIYNTISKTINIRTVSYWITREEKSTKAILKFWGTKDLDQNEYIKWNKPIYISKQAFSLMEGNWNAKLIIKRIGKDLERINTEMILKPYQGTDKIQLTFKNVYIPEISENLSFKAVLNLSSNYEKTSFPVKLNSSEGIIYLSDTIINSKVIVRGQLVSSPVGNANINLDLYPNLSQYPDLVMKVYITVRDGKLNITDDYNN